MDKGNSIVTKITCERREHCRMVTLLNLLTAQCQTSVFPVAPRALATSITWQFRDQGLIQYRVKIQENRVLILQEVRRMATIIIHN